MQSRKAFKAAHRAKADATPFSPPWTASADYPVAVSDNAAATAPDGTVYSVGGTSPESSDGLLRAGWALDPSTGTWTALPDMPRERYEARCRLPARQALRRRRAGTRTATRSPRWTSTTRPPGRGPQARRCRSRSARRASRWSAARSTSSADAATSRSAGRHAVQIYDPVATPGAPRPDYPVATSWLSLRRHRQGPVLRGRRQHGGQPRGRLQLRPGRRCVDADRRIALAAMGGVDRGAGRRDCSPRAACSDAGGALTNAGFAYDPSADAWTSLPNANKASYGAAGACGCTASAAASIRPN